MTSPRLPVALGERVDVMPVVDWLRPQIIEALPAIEEQRGLPQSLVDAMFDAGLMHSALPREFGGLELHVVDLVDLIFELSRISGAVGWTLVIQHGGEPLREPELMRELIDDVDGRWIVSGSHGRVGTTRKVDGGYLFTGHWAFASGAPWATYLTAWAHLVDDDGNLIADAESGGPILLEALFRREAVEYIDGWNSMGLRGSGSGEFTAQDVFVEDRCVYPPALHDAYFDRAIYRSGAMIATTAVAMLGMAQGTLDAFVALTRRPRRTNSTGLRAAMLGEHQAHQMSVGEADSVVQSAYQWLRYLTQKMLDLAFSEDEDAVEETRTRLFQSCTYSAQAARAAATSIYLAAGSDSVMVGRDIERHFRDVFVAGQHTGTLPTTYADYGKYHLARHLPGLPDVDEDSRAQDLTSLATAPLRVPGVNAPAPAPATDH